MRKNSFTVMKSIIVLAMLIPAVALANEHKGYTYATATPATVAPGGTITVEFGYTVNIDEPSFNFTAPNTYSRWEIRLDGGTSRVDPPLILGHPYYGPTYPTDGEATFSVSVDLIIPEDTEDGPHTIDIYSCVWSYTPAWYGLFYGITIMVEQSDPALAILDLIDTVAEMNLQQGIDNSLDAKLDAAVNALDDVNENNDVAAINSLNAFKNAVEAQRDNKLTDAQADELIAQANGIIAMLSG